MMSGDEEEEEEEETLLEEGEEEPTEQDRRVWSYLSSSLGFRMKPGEDVKIVRLMIPFLAQCCGRLPPEGPARCVHIKMFIHQFQTYIIKYCLSDLNDVEMLLDVIAAVESSPANPENKLKKNIPTKEEGIAAPMYILKLERREYGDHSRKGPAEENLVANPIAIVQSAEGQESYEKSNESLQVNFAASDAGIDLATHSVGLDDNEKDGNCDGSGEFGDYSRKGPAEENLVATPIATVQSADHHENQIYPAANSHKGDDGGDYEKGVIEKCNKIGDAGFNEKAETSNLCGDDKSKGATENFSTDPASNLESVSFLSELQVNPVTNLHESGDAAGDCEKDKTKKSDIIGYDGDHEKAEKYASSRDISKSSTEKTFAEDSTKEERRDHC